VDISLLNGLVNFILRTIVFPLANNVLQTGIPLPVVDGTRWLIRKLKNVSHSDKMVILLTMIVKMVVMTEF
jgi:hypothetical protein